MKTGKLPSLPLWVRLLAFLGVALALYGGFWYFMTRPTRNDTKEITDKINALLPKNAQAQIAQQRLNEFRKIILLARKSTKSWSRSYTNSANSPLFCKCSGPRTYHQPAAQVLTQRRCATGFLQRQEY